MAFPLLLISLWSPATKALGARSNRWVLVCDITVGLWTDVWGSPYALKRLLTSTDYGSWSRLTEAELQSWDLVCSTGGVAHPMHSQNTNASLVQPSLLPVENTKAPTGEVT